MVPFWIVNHFIIRDNEFCHFNRPRILKFCWIVLKKFLLLIWLLQQNGTNLSIKREIMQVKITIKYQMEISWILEAIFSSFIISNILNFIFRGKCQRSLFFYNKPRLWIYWSSVFVFCVFKSDDGNPKFINDLFIWYVQKFIII